MSADHVDPLHRLVLLPKAINWERFGKTLKYALHKKVIT